MPIVVEMPGNCPLCGGRILKRTSKNGYTFYACERGKDCGFMTWDVPTKRSAPNAARRSSSVPVRVSARPFASMRRAGTSYRKISARYKKKTVSGDGEKEKEGTSAEGKGGTKKTTSKKTTTKKKKS
jgi:DNA topoisomerase-1